MGKPRLCISDGAKVRTTLQWRRLPSAVPSAQEHSQQPQRTNREQSTRMHPQAAHCDPATQLVVQRTTRVCYHATRRTSGGVLVVQQRSEDCTAAARRLC